MNYKTTFCCLLLLSCFLSYGQLLDDIDSDSLVKIPESIAIQQFGENIYIHTDKDIYEPGEDLWFKAYILHSNSLKLSRETNVVFAKLIKEDDDGEHESILREKYEATNGFVDGHLFLGETLKAGSYKLTMYTKKTLESNSKDMLAVKRFQIKESIIPKILMDTEFSKKSYKRTEPIVAEVSVFSRSRVPYKNAALTAFLYNGNKKIDRMRVRTNDEGIAAIRFPAQKSKKATAIQLRVKYDDLKETHTIEIPFSSMSSIQFGMYPEGGSLVENLPNTLAFKALDPNGRPVPVKGVLYENGTKIQSFSAVHSGMGKLNFTPKEQKKYTVKLTQPRIDSIFELPQIKPEGIKLQVDRRNANHIHFSITKSKRIPAQKAFIRAQHRGLVYWMATANLEKERVTFSLPLEKFPQGIAEVTVFNEHYQPLAERLVYTNLDQKLHVTLKEISKSSFQQKDKVTMKFEVKDQDENPAIANFSLSIHDHLYAEKINNYAMMPHYYLFSELKGHVYEAGYYFDPKNKNRAAHLDLLMLTQGWRNYVWNKRQLVTNYNKVTFTPYLKGKAFQKMEDGRLQRKLNANIQVSYPKVVHQVLVDSLTGNFELPVYAYQMAQGSDIILFPLEKGNTIIDVEDPFRKIDKITTYKSHIFPINDMPLQSKKQSSYDSKFSFSETNYLEEVNLTGFKKRKKNFGSGGDFQASSTDYVCFEYNILNCINHNSGPKPENGETYRLNNGSYVKYYFKGNDPTAQENDRFVKIRGLYPEKEFYSPNYDEKDDRMFPDNRKTLFWAPNLISDENGIITVNFFTSDVQTTFLGKIEGTNGNGLLGGTVFKFDVN